MALSPAEYAAQVRSLVDASLGVGTGAGERPSVLLVTSSARDETAVRALQDEIDLHILDRGGLLLPVRVLSAVRRIRPAAVIAETPYLGFGVLMGLAIVGRDRPSVIVEAHDDWRRNPSLRSAGPCAVGAGGRSHRPLHASARGCSSRGVAVHGAAHRAGGGRAGARVLPGVLRPERIHRRAPGTRAPDPSALFVGMLERSKGISTLVDAWPRVVERLPAARLVVVGRGPQADLVEGFATTFRRASTTSSVAPRRWPCGWTSRPASSCRRSAKGLAA